MPFFYTFSTIPRFRCATLDRSDQTISQTLRSYQIIVRPKTLWSDRSATQESVRPKCDPKDLWSDYRAIQIFRATLLQPKFLCDFSATSAPSDQTFSEYML